MVDNLVGAVEPGRLTRIDVSFHLGGASVDTVIGRAAHIRFLDSVAATLMLVYNHRRCFE